MWLNPCVIGAGDQTHLTEAGRAGPSTAPAKQYLLTVHGGGRNKNKPVCRERPAVEMPYWHCIISQRWALKLHNLGSMLSCKSIWLEALIGALQAGQVTRLFCNFAVPLFEGVEIERTLHENAWKIFRSDYLIRFRTASMTAWERLQMNKPKMAVEVTNRSSWHGSVNVIAPVLFFMCTYIMDGKNFACLFKDQVFSASNKEIKTACHLGGTALTRFTRWS